LGPKTEIRHNAYVRGGVITGAKALIGHATEIKSSILLNEAKAPHFAYVGDSILGNGVNLGAGTKVSNLKITSGDIRLKIEDDIVSTGIRKMGAIVGDKTETGCNSVLNPGTLLAKGCLVFPASSVPARYYPKRSEIK
jgi:NDP-sugar pyrophosphorylase family protein